MPHKSREAIDEQQKAEMQNMHDFMKIMGIPVSVYMHLKITDSLFRQHSLPELFVAYGKFNQIQNSK